MLESHITESDLYLYEPALRDHIRTDEIDLSSVITASRTRLNHIIASKGIDFKKLCTRLSLTNDTKSGEDLINRNRLIVDATSVTGESTFTLSGTESTSYTEIFSDLVVTETGKYTRLIEDTYSYYKLTKSGTITFTAYMVESSFEYPHILLSLHMAFLKLIDIAGANNFQDRVDFYFMEFEKALNEMNYSYDIDADNDIDNVDYVYSNSIKEITR